MKLDNLIKELRRYADRFKEEYNIDPEDIDVCIQERNGDEKDFAFWFEEKEGLSPDFTVQYIDAKIILVSQEDKDE